MVALRNNLTRLTLLKILQAYGAAAIYGRALAAMVQSRGIGH